jgi:hypothetical protein
MRWPLLASIHDWSIALHPAPLVPNASAGANAGLIVCLLLAAGLLLWWWQRGMPHGWHTRVRWFLLIALGLLLFSPQTEYETERTTSGTLFLVLDQSRSMDSQDPQSSAIERLRWADALGYLPAGTRRGRPDHAAAEVDALRQQLADLQAAGAIAGPDDAAHARYIEALHQWRAALDRDIAAFAEDELVSGPGSPTVAALKRLSSAVEDALSATGDQQTARGVAENLPWPGFDNDLAQARDALIKIADEADGKVLRERGTDSDVASALTRVATMSRAELAAAALTHASGTSKSINTLAATYRTQMITVADAARSAGTLDPAAAADTLSVALTPNGNSTNLTAGFSLVGESINNDEPASIVLVSDGRQNAPSDPAEAARLLAARGVRIYGLTIGSEEVAPDAAVEEPDAPDWIFAGDSVAASARVRLDGLSGVPLHVDFLRDGAVIDTQPIVANAARFEQRISFHDKPTEVRNYSYAIRVAEAPHESNRQNNEQPFHIVVKKDRLNVLLVDDAPRWEFRYLAAALRRDQRIKLQTVLLQPADVTDVTPPLPRRASITNPDVEAQLLPTTATEWNAFDVIIWGDVPPESLPPLQQQFLLEAVRDRGATLIGIAGRNAFPAAYRDTPLAAALPVTAGDWTPAALQADNDHGFRPGIAPEGDASVLTQLGLDADSNATAWADMPMWYWHSDWTAAKPAASVFWSIDDPTATPAAQSTLGDAALARRHALLSAMPLGSGRVMFLAADQSWRLRQVNGDELHTRFWGQVIRWAVGTDLPIGGKWVRFGTGRTSYTAGEPITITARVLHEDLAPYTGLTIRAIAHAAPNNAEGETVGTTDLSAIAGSPGYYRGTFVGLPAGPTSITLDNPEVSRLLTNDPSVGNKAMAISILAAAALEQRNTNTDPAEMRRIAAAGGGVALAGPYADVLADQIPAIERTIRTTEHAGFFADPASHATRWLHLIFGFVFVTLLTTEWILRKRRGLA